ncbi:MAG: O-acetyl-ADP-ribose deacetylase [Clostridiales bacterium]|nr:O-acetyl-ADP-ribose deacetylase [Clostridiales bacterium]
MPLEIVRNDITKMCVDAIVNAANPSLLGGGGVDGAIHRAAGPRLLEACRALHGCRTGEAKITPGFDLPCRHVIHTVGPIWQDGRHGERAMLSSCYKSALALAQAHGCESVAFPLISAGAYGYPRAQAVRVAVDAISGFLLEHEMMVYLVVYTRDAFEISGRLFADIAAYIDDVYVDAHRETCSEAFRRRTQDVLNRRFAGEMEPLPRCAAPMAAQGAELDDRLSRLDEGFSQMLLRKIDEKHMTDAACYKKANIDRRLFHKIKNNPAYRPEKTTVLAFAIALELPLKETRDMLEKAGYALSHASKFDIIVEYFLERGNYNVFEINEALFAFDQSLIGV